MPDIVPFDEFLAATAAATAEQYSDALAAGSELAGITRAEAEAEFERMKAYILAYYEGIHPVSSHLDSNEQTIDCVPFDQQPTVRAARMAGRVVTDEAPPPPKISGASHPLFPARVSPPPHRPVCPAETVPIVRLTLDRMARLGTLDNFFCKSPRKTTQRD